MTQLIWDRVPATLLLVVTSVLGAFLAGTLLGTLAARKQRAAVAGHHAAVHRRVLGAGVLDRHPAHHPVRVDAADLPVSDMRTAGASELGWSGALDVLHHLVLPACTLGFVYLANTAGWRAPA